jgi:cytochrome b subunit of formate dehydrogenase
MTLPRLSILARKIHRFCVLIIIAIGLVMMVTGSIMKYPELFTFSDPFAARRLHNILSTYFSIILFVMMLTGGYLYIFPWIMKRVRKSSPVSP